MGAPFAAPPALSRRADDGIRTRDPHLGKVMLYQLSHVRVCHHTSAPQLAFAPQDNRSALP